jgi:hypothetical protein
MAPTDTLSRADRKITTNVRNVASNGGNPGLGKPTRGRRRLPPAPWERPFKSGATYISGRPDKSVVCATGNGKKRIARRLPIVGLHLRLGHELSRTGLTGAPKAALALQWRRGKAWCLSWRPDGDRMAMKRTASERIAGNRKPGALSLAEVEFRVVWNEKEQGWNVFRNGTMTSVAGRKKKKSAVDSAIREAKIEFEASGTRIVVICLEGRKLETVWKGP